MEPVTKRPMKSVTTRPPRKIRKKEREWLCVLWKDFRRTIKAIRFEVRPKALKMDEYLTVAIVWLYVNGGLLME